MKPILAVIGGFLLSFGMFVGGILFALFVMVDESPQRLSTTSTDAADVWASEPRAVNTETQNFERVPAAEQPGAVNGGGAAAAAAAPLAPGGVEPAVDTMTTAAVPPRAAEPPRVTEPVGALQPPRPVNPAPAAEPPAAESTLPAEPEAAEPAPEDRAADRLLTAHTEWCSRRYHSYDASTNSYSPFSGRRRPCMSPYWSEYAALTGAAMPAETNERFVPVAEEPSVGEIIPPEEDASELGYADDIDTGEDMGLVIDDQHVMKCFSRYRSYRPEDNTYQPFGGGPRRQCE